jgi:hypothetical protein
MHKSLLNALQTFNFNLTTWMSSVQKGKQFRWIQLVSQSAKFKGVFIIIILKKSSIKSSFHTFYMIHDCRLINRRKQTNSTRIKDKSILVGNDIWNDECGLL